MTELAVEADDVEQKLRARCKSRRYDDIGQKLPPPTRKSTDTYPSAADGLITSDAVGMVS